MKLLTLNTHSLEEPGYEEKLNRFVDEITRRPPEIMALQEVNQRCTGEEVSAVTLIASGYLPCPGPGEPKDAAMPLPAAGVFPAVRRDNHAFRAASALARRGIPYFWTWVPAKLGYGRYDEGLALFSRLPIAAAGQFYLTDGRDYGDWRTRKAVYISVRDGERLHTFYCVHMGWWEDEKEPFLRQWERLSASAVPAAEQGSAWLLGDFNSPAHVRGEGYDQIRGDGWTDAYEAAAVREGKATVPGAIDGWRSRGAVQDMRIDYIWYRTELPIRIRRVETVFDSLHQPAVSDHYGVLAEWEEGNRQGV